MNLRPGEKKTIYSGIPPGLTAEQLKRARVRVRFGCGVCGRDHEEEVGINGGVIEVTCLCGANLKLEAGPVRRVE